MLRLEFNREFYLWAKAENCVLLLFTSKSCLLLLLVSEMALDIAIWHGWDNAILNIKSGLNTNLFNHVDIELMFFKMKNNIFRLDYS